MSVTARVLPDGSLAVTDNGVTHSPLSVEAVQAVAAQAGASAAAHNSQELAEGLALLAQLITAAAPLAGEGAYAQVTVTPGRALAVVDGKSFGLLTKALPGRPDGLGGWVAGPLTVTAKPADPADPTGGGAAATWAPAAAAAGPPDAPTDTQEPPR